MGAIDISYLSLAAFYSILILPILISLTYKLRVVKNLLISVLRMTVQMGLVGFYLDFLFRYNRLWLNLLWVIIMMFAANFTLVKRAQLNLRHFFFATSAGLAAASFTVGIFFIVFTVRPDPFYDAPYVIPIMGMILGNCMRGNILALERFYSSIRKNEKEFLTYLLMGATLREAVVPYMRESIRPALAPQLSTMATLGIVSLPGMMTGQILGGTSPLIAIKYQLAVMIAIFTAIALSTFINIFISMKIAFNDYKVLKRDLFRSQT